MQKPTILYGEEKPTYYVIAAGGQAPTKEHHSRITARNEATRLSKENPGVKFSVVKLKDAVIFDPAGAGPVNVENLEKQVFARALLKAGQKVRVKKSHYAHAGRTGFVNRLGDLGEGDPSVYVILTGDADERRFSASSLSPAVRYNSDGNDEPKADDTAGLEAPPMLNLLAGLILGAAANKLRDLFEEEGEDVPGGMSSEERREHMTRVTAIPPGAEVGVIIQFAGLGGLMPPRIMKGRFLSTTPNITQVRIDFTPANGPSDEEVNISRVYRLDDPALAEAAGIL